VNGRFGYPLGFMAAVTVTIVTVAAHATRHPLWSVAALAVVTAALATATTLPAVLATAAVCWALHAGFVLGRHGELQFSAASGGAAVLLLTVAVVAYAASRAARGLRVRRQADRHAVTIPAPRRSTPARPVGSTPA
jgi:hypothetical protein